MKHTSFHISLIGKSILQLLLFLALSVNLLAQNKGFTNLKIESVQVVPIESKATADADLTQIWKLGVCLYTFSNFSFPDQLAKVDSAGLTYVEGYTFGKAGVELKDSMIMSLSPFGIEKLNALIKRHGLIMESIYVVGGNTVAKWKKDFELAKQLKVKYVTAEPAVHQLDMVDSLAGIYGIKVAIHNHWKGNSAYWHPDSVLLALKNHPNFAACPDLGHWPKSGINPVEGLKKLEGRIIAIHLKDIAEYNNPKLTDVPVGTGVINFPTVFEELKRQKFKGHIMIERDTKEKPSNLASVIQTVNYYRETLKLPTPKK
ncbi:sugar phosphate isomerase/epimerase family protein [Haliscomenobacter sp.]|uniref:sugar phosphate isomerase/epimerase family protein n=1 Tax=Haliscomenobacter sp. TaxID=2717303 RepID=UPI003BABE2DE